MFCWIAYTFLMDGLPFSLGSGSARGGGLCAAAEGAIGGGVTTGGFHK